MKQAIIMRADLKMSKGKLAAQAAHASLEAYKKAKDDARKTWEKEGQKKIVLRAESESDLLEIFMSAKKEKLPCALIRDMGLTQIPAGSATAAGIGPAEDGQIDRICGKLKLF